jgi:hypothetical protein
VTRGIAACGSPLRLIGFSSGSAFTLCTPSASSPKENRDSNHRNPKNHHGKSRSPGIANRKSPECVASYNNSTRAIPLEMRVASIALLMKMNGITTGTWTEIPAETLPVLQASPPSEVEAMLWIQEIISILLSTTLMRLKDWCQQWRQRIGNYASCFGWVRCPA